MARPGFTETAAVLACVALALAGCSADSTATTRTATDAGATAARLQVTRIVDGDTVWGTGRHDYVVKVRLALAEAPETSTTRYGHAECGGAPAARALRRLVAGRAVRLRRPGGEDEDQYGRTVAELFVRGRSVDEQLVRAGWAKPYRVPAAAGGADANRRIARAAADARS